jgi:hypothetical protein
MNSKNFTLTLLILFAIAIGISSFAQLKEGEKISPFSLKALDGAIVTVKIEEEKLIVITEATKDGKKSVNSTGFKIICYYKLHYIPEKSFIILNFLFIISRSKIKYYKLTSFFVKIQSISRD